MFNRRLDFSQKTFYIQIWEDRIKVVDIDTGDYFDEKPYLALETNDKGKMIVNSFGNSACVNTPTIKSINPFLHPRILVSNFFVAEKLMQIIISQLHSKTFMNASPKMVIHPMVKLDGGLTLIEKVGFRDLCYGAGATEVVIYTGHEINLCNFDYKKIKSEHHLFKMDKDQKNEKVYVNIAILAAISLVLLFMFGN